jgi:hypothetical protein
VARATRAEAATEAAREQVAALTLELKRSQAAQAAQAAVGAAGVGESPRGELRVVRTHAEYYAQPWCGESHPSTREVHRAHLQNRPTRPALSKRLPLGTGDAKRKGFAPALIQPALLTQVRAERDELAAEVAMLKQMVKTTSLAVNFKRSQHTSAETSLRSSQHTSRAASPTPSS